MVAVYSPKGIKAREVPDEFKWPAGARRTDARARRRSDLFAVRLFPRIIRRRTATRGFGLAHTAQRIKQGGCTKVRYPKVKQITR